MGQQADAASPFERILERLQNIRRHGSGGAKASCPAHNDPRPSLSIKTAADGKILLHCFGGCSTERVVEAIGLTMADLRPHSATNGRPLRAVKTEWTPIVPAPVDAPEPPMAHPRRGLPSATWTYYSPDGRVLTHDYRFDLGNGSKDVLPLTFAESDRGVRAWRFLAPVPRPIYGLDRLARQPDAPVAIVEGCKCADAGQQLLADYTIVSWQGGADAVDHVDWRPLAERSVVVWADNDPAGFRAAKKIAARLRLLGCQVRFVQIPVGKPVAWDVADAAAGGMTPTEVKALVDAATENESEFKSPEGDASGKANHGAVPEFSESALADEFERRYGADLSHCEDHWKFWSGKRWRTDEKIPFDLAENIGREAGARAELSIKNGEALARHLASHHTAKAIVALAGKRASLSSTRKDWDSQPLLLGTPDGVIDFESGKRLDPKREYRITKSTAVVPAETSDGAVNWRMALDLIYQSDQAMISHVQKLLGYSATADVREDTVVVPHGRGGNGKTLVFGTAAKVLGTYAHSLAAEALMETYGERHPEELARLEGVRMALGSEIPAGRNWNTARLKLLSGRDEIPARDMYGKSFKFCPSHKLLIVGNHLPGLQSVDPAITGRMQIIPHTVQFRGTNLEIKGLDVLLEKEWPYILRWIIEGTAKWLREGLKPPPEVVKATAAYFLAEDEIGGWLSTCCEEWPADAVDVPLDKDGRPTSYTSLTELTRSYDEWRDPRADKGIRKTSPKSFGAKLREKGYATEHKRIGTVVWGLRIRRGDNNAA